MSTNLERILIPVMKPTIYAMNIVIIVSIFIFLRYQDIPQYLKRLPSTVQFGFYPNSIC